jgi:hypothetical protein
MSDKTSDYSVWHFLLIRIRVTRRESSFRAHNTLQRTNTENLKQIFPEKEFGGHSPDFHIHVSVSDLYIPTIDLPILQQEICGPILGMHKFTLLLLNVAPPRLTYIYIRVLNYLVYFTNVSSHAEACRLEVNKNLWLKNFMSDKL